MPHDYTDLADVQRELEVALAPNIQLLHPIGRGAMGAVFLARDPVLRRHVVVKVLSPALANDLTARARFAREAEAAAAVSHPNVVGVFHVGELPRSGTSYFVMQHVDGQTLADACPLGTKISQARARRIVGEIASALAAAHARGLIHRDIKPANIMLERQTERVVVLDFGISAAAKTDAGDREDRLTMQGTSIGTPEYMSPEAAAGEDVTDRSDVYSLGVVAFELLAGRAPFKATSPMALFAAHMKDTPPSIATLRPDLDPALVSLVDHMLAKQADDRPSAEEIARTLITTSHVIEWPPPGLEHLRGRGGVSLRLLVASMLVAPVCTMIVVTAGREVWLTVALLAAVTAILLEMMMIVSVSIVLGLTRWSKRSGYPFEVSADALLDQYGDTAAVLNGTGVYASLPAGTGRAWLARRRWAALAILVGAFVATIVAALWAIGVIDLTGPSAASSLNGAVILVLYAPALAALGLAHWLRGPERTARRRLQGERPLSSKDTKRAPIPAELVSGWLAGAGLPQPQSRPRGAIATFLGTQLIEIPISLAMLLAVFAILGGFISAGIASIAQPGDPFGLADRRTLERAIGGFTASGSPRSWDSIVGRNAIRPASAADPEAARELATVLVSIVRSGLAAFPAVDPADVWSVSTALPRTAPEAMRARLTAAAGHPAVAAYRRFATAGGSDAPWYSPSDGLRSDSTSRALRRTMNGLRQLTLRAAAAAALDFDRGDVAGAAARAREIIAVGWRLSRDPAFVMHTEGVGVVEIGTRLLFEAGVASGDRAMIRDADALRDVVSRRRANERLMGMAAFGAAGAPLDERLVDLAGDQSLFPAVRWSLVRAVATGVCWSPVEFRRGVSPLRYALLTRAGERIADIPHAAEWVAVQRTFLDGLQSGKTIPLAGWPVTVVGIPIMSARRATWCGY